MVSGRNETLLICPHCGAPYREAVPSGVVQVKCRYCGGMIIVEPWTKETAPRCPNHPEKIANRECDDCRRDFCEDCLSVYKLKDEHVEATLRLCRECIVRRCEEETEKYLLSGILLLLAGFLIVIIGTLTAMELLISGSILVLLGASYMIYYSRKRAKTLKEHGFSP